MSNHLTAIIKASDRTKLQRQKIWLSLLDGKAFQEETSDGFSRQVDGNLKSKKLSTMNTSNFWSRFFSNLAGMRKILK